MKNIFTYAVLSSVLLSTGCASILNEKTQAINISASNGKTIEGTVDGKAFKAPGVVALTRAQAGKVIEVTTPGCTPKTALEANVDSKFWINILSGGVFGSSTDYGTEKMWRYNDPVVISCSQ